MDTFTNINFMFTGKRNLRRQVSDFHRELSGICRGVEGVCVPQDDAEMCEQGAWQERYDDLEAFAALVHTAR